MPISFPNRLNSIQALRGIAAMMVLFFHISEFQRFMAVGTQADIDLVSGIWDQGWAGVDLFFVISGFIMVYVTRESGHALSDAWRFLRSRITRIYPLWWICAGFMILYFFVSYGVPAAPDRINSTSEAYSYALRSLLLIPQGSEPILPLGWTLIHEMFFYLVFTGLLLFSRRVLPYALIIWALVTLLTGALMATPGFATHIWNIISSPLSLEFIAGGLTAWVVLGGFQQAPKIVIGTGLIALVTVLIVFQTNGFGADHRSRVALLTLPFVAIVFGWVTLEIQGRATIPSWLISLGNWSYSLYLTHYIVLIALRRLYRQNIPDGLVVGADGALDNIVFAVLALAISLIVAASTYRFIERPLIAFFKRPKTIK